ncbi:MAG: oligopeptide transporter, OPT family [Gemmatimonadota bacterium]|nr:oligopeptide transporter, OPT family [Gemmatimonadota bacterium]
MSPPPADPHLEPTLDRIQVAGDEELHKPYVPPSTELTELTLGAIVLGIVLGLIFAASSVYLALKVGLTVSASIPIAVLSITIFRYFSRAFGMKPATILQNNIVQTTGSAGESIAAGVVFTLPALLLLGYNLPWPKVAAIAFVGGLLGVLLMIPLRKSLIVKEHRNLKYPEGTACAEVLIVGEEGGIQAKTVFMGFGLGALYKLCNTGFKLWRDTVAHTFTTVAAGRPQLLGEIQSEISPELTGVGYIIGPKVAGYLFAGGLLSFFVLIPAIKLFGAGLTTPMFPATKLIADMDASTVRSQYIYYIGAGAVTTAGLISLLRALPTILSAMVGSFRGMRGAGSATIDAPLRTQRDLPMWIVGAGTLVLAILMMVVPQIHINLLGAILAIFFAFLFVTVSSRITGQIGASANPISGMTIATVLFTALVFLAVGWTGIEHRVLALSIGGVVCVAAAVAGATSQDLKTGFLVGATPARQQIGLMFGVVTSAILIGFTIQFLNEASTTIVARQYAGVTIPAANFDADTRTLKDGTTYRVGHLYERTGEAPAGKYLVDQSGAIKYLVDPGIGGKEETDYTGRTIKKLDSPKSQIMALVVDGILTQKLPWGLILIGAFLAIAMEVLGIPSLPVAVGVYLSIATSATIFMGGMVRLLVERRMSARGASIYETDSGPGVLFSSGLIAGGALMNVAVQALVAKELDKPLTQVGAVLGPVAESQILSFVLYIVFLAVPLYLVAKRQSALNSPTI